MVREYRSPEEVFAPDSLASLTSAPVTLHHPGRVTPSNWRKVSVGHVETPEASKSGEWVEAPILVADGAALSALEGGQFGEVSCAFDCDPEEAQGTSPEGEPYDLIVRNIRYNHVALLPVGTRGRVSGAELLRMDSEGNEVAEESPDKEPLMESQVWTLIAEALAPLGESVAGLQSALAAIGAKVEAALALPAAAAAPEASPPVPGETPPEGPEGAEGQPPEPGAEVDPEAEVVNPEAEADPEEEPPVDPEAEVDPEEEVVNPEAPPAAKGKAPFPPKKPGLPVSKGKAPLPSKRPGMRQDADEIDTLRADAAEAAVAAAEARADALAARGELEALRASIPDLVADRRQVEDHAVALGIPLVPDTEALRKAVVTRAIPTPPPGLRMDAAEDVATLFRALTIAAPPKALGSFFAPPTSRAPAEKVPSDADRHRDRMRSMGPR